MPNPNHDARGQFSSGESAGAGMSSHDQGHQDLHSQTVSQPLREAQRTLTQAHNRERDLKTHFDYHGIKDAPALREATIARERAGQRVADLKTHYAYHGIKE